MFALSFARSSHYSNSALLVLAAALALVTACTPKQEAKEAIRPVLVQKVVPSDGVEHNVYSGEIKARHEADLGFRIGGKIVSRQAEVGSLVKKGAVLARIDPADAALNAEAARAQVAAAETEHSFAKAELERYRSLLEKRFISQAVYDARLNAYNSAKAKLEQLRSQYAWSRNQASYADLVADQDGVITAVNAEPGQVVAAGQAVLRLSRPEEKEVVINVPESRLNELRAAQRIAVSLWAEPGKRYRGQVREVSPNADAVTRTFTAKISVLDAGLEVKLGMTANVLVGGVGNGGKGEDRVLLPLTALMQENGQPAVWVLDAASGKVALRTVKVGQYHENGVNVVGGLQPGELVVTAGVHKLIPGQVVRPVEQTLVAGK